MIGELIPTGVTFGVGRSSINTSFSATAEFNNVVLDSGGNFSGGTGGGAIFSAGTDLYSIFSTNTSGGSDTFVQGGTNISTGGTASVPIVNLDDDIVLTSVTATTINTSTYLDFDPETEPPTPKAGRMFFSGTPIFRMFYNSGGTHSDWVMF